MNVYDTVRMSDSLRSLGYERTDGPDDADLIVLNTCHIREKAAEKVYSDLGRLRLVKERRAQAGKRTVLAVAGCVAQAEGAEITVRAPFVDLVFGPQTMHRLPEMLAGLDAAPDRRYLDTDFPVESKFDHLPEETAGQGVSAYLAVQEGCDKFCSFCVVPYTRGAEFSRPVVQILAEARRLIAAGAREITLLGQNVNAYHGTGPDGRPWGLARLLQALAELAGLDRLRYTTSHPRDMDDALIAAHASVPSLMPFLHLPIQSGSDRMLAAMNRRHTTSDYLRLVERLRAARADLALSSDFIIGHPGETDADFAETLALVRRVGYAQAYSFKYSPRPGTPAADAPEQVPETVKAERLAALQALLNQQQVDFNRRSEGNVLPVLFDRSGKRAHQWLGRSPYMQSVHVESATPLGGRLEPILITAGLANSLAGRRLADAPPSAIDPAHGRATEVATGAGPLEGPA